MDAELRGDDFEIVPRQTLNRQSVPDSTYREWIWQITPKYSGRTLLLITVQPIAAIPGFGAVAVGEPYRDAKNIQVEFNWSYWRSRL